MASSDRVQDMTLDEIRDAWRNGTPFDGAHLCPPAPIVENDDLAEARAHWRTQVEALIATPVASDIPEGDTVIAVLEFDRLGPFMDQIEASAPVTIAIKHEHHDYGHDLVLLRLTKSDADPFDWIADDHFEGCEFAYDSLFMQVASSALGVCVEAFWATDSEPAAWNMEVLYPLGHTLGSEHDFRIGIAEAAPQRLLAAMPPRKPPIDS